MRRHRRTADRAKTIWSERREALVRVRRWGVIGGVRAGVLAGASAVGRSRAGWGSVASGALGLGEVVRGRALDCKVDAASMTMQ